MKKIAIILSLFIFFWICACEAVHASTPTFTVTITPTPWAYTPTLTPTPRNTISYNTAITTATASWTRTGISTWTRTITITISPVNTETFTRTLTTTLTRTNTATMPTKTITPYNSFTASPTPTSTITVTAVVLSSCFVDWVAITPVAPIWYIEDKFMAITKSANIYVLTGTLADTYFEAAVWHSSDGVDWVNDTRDAEYGERSGFTAFDYHNNIYIMGGNGYQNDVWHSYNGVAWTRDTAAALTYGRFGIASCVFNDKIWVSGGTNDTLIYPDNQLNDVWYSTNGADWTAATRNAEFIITSYTGRYFHGMIGWKNKLWILGGQSAGGGYFNDVWSSPDGAYWTRETSNTGWSAGQGKNVFILNDTMYVFDTQLSQLWGTTDGVQWVMLTGRGSVPDTRIQSAETLFNDKLFTFGGYGDAFGPGNTNSIWYADIISCINTPAATQTAVLTATTRLVSILHQPTPTQTKSNGLHAAFIDQ